MVSGRLVCLLCQRTSNGLESDMHSTTVKVKYGPQNYDINLCITTLSVVGKVSDKVLIDGVAITTEVEIG